jgi:hypothetical protein
MQLMAFWDRSARELRHMGCVLGTYVSDPREAVNTRQRRSWPVNF